MRSQPAASGGKPRRMSWAADLRAGGMEVVGQASASHRLADVERGPAAGHRVDDQGAGGRVVVERMRHQGRRDGAGVGDAEGPVVPERPDVVRRRAEVGPEAVAAAEVLVGGVDRLGPGVELGDAAPSPGVARAGQSPDGPRLPVEVLASHARGAGRSPHRSGPGRRRSDAPVAGLLVGILAAARASEFRHSASSDESVDSDSPLRRLASRRALASDPQSSSRASASRISWLNVLRRWRLYSRIAAGCAAPGGRRRTSQGTSASPRAGAQASRRCPEMTSQVPGFGPGAHDQRRPGSHAPGRSASGRRSRRTDRRKAIS